jgi:type III secretion protein Q
VTGEAALALTRALFPRRAEALARLLPVPPPQARALSDDEALARLAAALRGVAVRVDVPRGSGPLATRLALELAVRAAAPAALRTPDRAPAPAAEAIRSREAGPGTARPVLREPAMFPFDVACVSPAAVEVDDSVVAAASRAARAAEAGIASLLDGEVRITGRLLPGVPAASAAALVSVELTALAGQAHLAVECGFAARLAERVAGTAPSASPATALSPVERTVLEMIVLAALDGLSAEPGVEQALGPRLGAEAGPLVRPLCLELAVSAAGVAGRVLLVVPERVVRALRDPAPAPPVLLDAAVEATVRHGRITLDADEVRHLREGDVLLLDEPPGDSVDLELPGGASVRGRLGDDELEVEEVLPDPGPGQSGVPVPIDVALATVALPVRELGRITPGAVIPLGIARDGGVALRIGGRTVARGELVDVDGAVGVRVLSRGGPA